MILNEIRKKFFSSKTTLNIQNRLKTLKANNGSFKFINSEMYLESRYRGLNSIMRGYQEFIRRNLRKEELPIYFLNENHLEDVKFFLNEINSQQTNLRDYFVYEFTNILRKLFKKSFFENFTNDSNRTFLFSTLYLIKNISETEFLIKNLRFVEDFFEILMKSTENLNEYLQNNNNIKNSTIPNIDEKIEILDEYFDKILYLVESKFVQTYNPIFYTTLIEDKFSKLLDNFSFYFLFHSKRKISTNPNTNNSKYINGRYQKNSNQSTNNSLTIFKDRILKILLILNAKQIYNMKFCDYISLFIMNHLEELDKFFIIDSIFFTCNYFKGLHYNILHHLYNQIQNDDKQGFLINYPTKYLIRIIEAFSKYYYRGGFILAERINEIIMVRLINEELPIKDLCNLLVSLMRSYITHNKVIDYYLNKIMRSKFDFDIIKARYIKSVMERLSTETHYSNEEFFEFISKKCLAKWEELKFFIDNYDNEMFKEYIKNEIMLAKENYSNLELISKDDLFKYNDLIQKILAIAFFKLNYEYKFLELYKISFKVVNLPPFNDSEKIIDFSLNTQISLNKI